MIKLVPLEPDAKLQRLATAIAVGAVLVITAVLVPLAGFQLGDKGWSLLMEDGGAPFWPLAGIAALGAVLLLAYTLGLHRRPRLAVLLVLVPAALTLSGTLLGASAIWSAGTPRVADDGQAVARLAATLATPGWALILAAGTAAAGSVVLGARELARSRSLELPWTPLLAALAVITAINTWPTLSKMPHRPLTSLLVAMALLGPLLVAATWSEDSPTEPEADPGATLTLCVLLALGTALAAAGAESLIYRGAALYAQGPGAESHDHSIAYGGARGTTLRLVSGLLVLGGTLGSVLVSIWRFRDRLWPTASRAKITAMIALVLVTLSILGVALHRHTLSTAITTANRAPPPTAPATPAPPARPASRPPR